MRKVYQNFHYLFGKKTFLLLSAVCFFILFFEYDLMFSFILMGTTIFLCIKSMNSFSHERKHDKKTLIIAMIILFVKSLFFSQTWIQLPEIVIFAEYLRLPPRVFLILIGFILSVLSFWFVINFLYLLSKKMNENDVFQEDSNIRDITAPLIFLISLSICIITICSKSSPLYPLNDWVDSNCFFTVGKSMFNGVVPYRDILEQKGPLLYFIHGVAWLISHKTFFGVYLIEILCCFSYLYFSCKIIKTISNINVYVALPIIAWLTYSSTAFCHGDSAEELCLPLLAYGLYVSTKFMVTKEEILPIDSFCIGITSGCVLWIKFTLLGFYVGWIIVPGILYLRQKKIRLFFILLFRIVVGVALVTLPFVCYFALNHAIIDWLKVYFYDNLFLYRLSSHTSILKNVIWGIYYSYCQNITIFHLYAFEVVVSLMIRENHMRENLLIIMFFSVFFIYMGGRCYSYYCLALSVFLIFAAGDIGVVTKDYFKYCIDTKLKIALILCVSFLCFLSTSNRYLLLTDKNKMPQFQFAEIIAGSGISHPTLLNYGFLDGGFYTTTGIIPNCKSFCRLNTTLPEMYEEQELFVNHAKCDFIVTRNTHLLSTNYQCIAHSNFFFEGDFQDYYLYQKVNKVPVKHSSN